MGATWGRPPPGRYYVRSMRYSIGPSIGSLSWHTGTAYSSFSAGDEADEFNPAGLLVLVLIVVAVVAVVAVAATRKKKT